MTQANTFYKVLKLLTLLVLGFALSSTQALAAKEKDIFERFRKPIQEVPKIEEDEFRQLTLPIKKTPYGDKALAYTMRVPKKWQESDSGGSSNFILNEKLFLDLNKFYGPAKPSGRSRIEIQAISMQGNLTAEQWYLQYVLESGFTTQGLVVHGENDIESLMVVMEQETSFFLRSRILRNGDKIVMARYFVPVERINEEVQLQAQCLESFALINEVAPSPIEMEMHRFLDIAELYHPKGWQVFAKTITSVDRLEATVVNVKEVGGKTNIGEAQSSATEAKLDVSLVLATPKSTLVEEVNRYRKKIELSGVLVGDKLENNYEFEYHDTIDFALTEVYEGIDSGNNLSEHEFWFTILVAGNYYTFLMLLTPSRNERFGVWAQNTQHYKEIVKNFKPMAGAFLERD